MFLVKNFWDIEIWEFGLKIGEYSPLDLGQNDHANIHNNKSIFGFVIKILI